MTRPDLAARVDALADAFDAAGDALPAALRQEGADLVARARQRSAQSAETTVVALAGATGTGKSSLFNALAGQPLATVAATRPTTAVAQAAVQAHDPAAAHRLLDWLDVPVRADLGVDLRADRAADPVAGLGSGGRADRTADRRAGLRSGDRADRGADRRADLTSERRADLGAGPVLPVDLVLLDLPDHDSVVAAHRAVAERLYQRVDLLVWVADPQKYADAVLHDRYLRQLAALSPVMVLVLNQADRLAPGQVETARADLARLAAADGLGTVPVLAVSARTGEGIDGLRSLLREAAGRRRAAADRLGAEVSALAGQVLQACGPGTGARVRAADDVLVDALERAAGVPVVVSAVRTSTSRRARAATGWPPLRWLGRFRADPLARLHLRGTAPTPRPDGSAPVPALTSLPAPGAAARAGAAQAVRGYLDAATAQAPVDWVLGVRSRVGADGMAEDLDRAVAAAPLLPSAPPRWWRAVGTAQWAALAVLLAGVAWLAGVAVLERALLVPAEPPSWRGLPVPTWLLLGGLLAGWLLALLGALGGALGARRRAERARAVLRSAVSDVAAARVTGPVADQLGRLDRARRSAERARG